MRIIIATAIACALFAFQGAASAQCTRAELEVIQDALDKEAEMFSALLGLNLSLIDALKTLRVEEEHQEFKSTIISALEEHNGTMLNVAIQIATTDLIGSR